MGWETRSGKRVYYRKERYRDAGGRSRVRSIYCGSGERGEAAAREDEERRRAAPPAENGLRASGEGARVSHAGEREAVDAFSRSPESLVEPAPPPAFAPRRRYHPSDEYLWRICGLPPRRKPTERLLRYRTTGSADAGVRLSGTRHSFTVRYAHMRRHGLGGGWLTDSKTGRFDEAIDADIAAEQPEAADARHRS